MAGDNAMYNKNSNKKLVGYIGDSSVNAKIGNSTISNGAVYQPKQITPTGDGGGGGGGGSKTPTSSNYGGVGDYLASLYAERQAAAQDAYDRSKALLDDAYNTASGNYANIYNSGANQLRKTYNNSLGKINENATDAFRQAYVNRMLSEKNLSQRLAAMGMSGGASESAMAGLLNNYGNARNGIQRTLDTNRNDLEMNYSNNLNDLYSAYQSQMASLDQNRASQLASLLNNLNNQIASVQGDYFSTLASNPTLLAQAIKGATASMNNYVAPETAQASNALSPVAVYQANDQGGTMTNASKLDWLEQYIANEKAKGVADEIIADTLMGNYGYTAKQLNGYI